MIKRIPLFAVVLLVATLTACKVDRATRQFAHGKIPKGHVLLDTVTVTGKKGVTPYQASATCYFDLVHTKLNMSFDIPKSLAFGKAEVTVHPHFYPQNHLVLDAKGMDIHEVALLSSGKHIPLSYNYNDSLHLDITLDKTYTKEENLTVFIDYTSKPNEYHEDASSAITDRKGLYFIDPLDTDPSKPTELWSQGEVQCSSVWFPTLDQPNQRMTQEINLRVLNKYKTLSNGLLINSVDNGDGTRTDQWKQDKTAPPYLTMIAFADFPVVKDTWRGKEVSYYIEPEYEPYARDIFGRTPEMMEFYSNLLGVPYQWDKYSQFVARDYVSGAMENASATVLYEGLFQTHRELIDRDNENIIAHELFHHWFGDLVTCESWSNLPLNESFADYGEVLWEEHAHGPEAGAQKHMEDMRSYFREAESKQVDLVRFYYDDPDEMFDRHSYEKGGCVLHMLRHYLGDEAFFAGLKKYLTENSFQSAEVPQLRIAMEKVSGQDLNWFFNQWFYNSGHPLLDFKYSYANDTLTIDVTQSTSKEGIKMFRLPMKIDIYSASGIITKDIVIDKGKQQFRYALKEKPLLVNADADKITLAKISENKSTAEYIYQYNHGKLYRDRYESVEYLVKHQKEGEEVQNVLIEGLHDKNWHIRRMITNKISYSYKSPATLTENLREIAKSDPKSLVRADAISTLSKLKNKEDLSIFERGLKDSSYSVLGASISAISDIDSNSGLSLARQYKSEKTYALVNEIADVLAMHGTSSDQDFFEDKVKTGTDFVRYQMLYHYANFLSRMGKAEFDIALPTYRKVAIDKEDEIMSMTAQASLRRLKKNYELRRKAIDTELKDVAKGDLAALNRLEEKAKFYDDASRRIGNLLEEAGK
jgi:aminopeptidase N